MDGDLSFVAPMITVVIPCYNVSLELLREVVQPAVVSSIVGEVLLIDDSGEGVLQKDQVGDSEKIRVLRNEKNLGLNKSRLTGIANARYDFVALNDADDVSSEVRFERQYAYMTENGFDAVVAGGVEVYRDGSVRRNKTYEGMEPEEFIDGFVKGKVLPFMSTLMIDRTRFSSALYDFAGRNSEYIFLAEIFLKGLRFGLLPGNNISKLHSASGLSNNYSSRAESLFLVAGYLRRNPEGAGRQMFFRYFRSRIILEMYSVLLWGRGSTLEIAKGVLMLSGYWPLPAAGIIPVASMLLLCDNSIVDCLL